jgi:hypothetical protein
MLACSDLNFVQRYQIAGVLRFKMVFDSRIKKRNARLTSSVSIRELPTITSCLSRTSDRHTNRSARQFESSTVLVQPHVGFLEVDVGVWNSRLTSFIPPLLRLK